MRCSFRPHGMRVGRSCRAVFGFDENNFDVVGLCCDNHNGLTTDPAPMRYHQSPGLRASSLVSPDSPRQFLTLAHLAHMAIGAVGLREVYRFATGQFGRGLLLSACRATAMVPVMNAQLGFMYLEIPIFTVGMLSVNAALNVRREPSRSLGSARHFVQSQRHPPARRRRGGHLRRAANVEVRSPVPTGHCAVDNRRRSPCPRLRSRADSTATCKSYSLRRRHSSFGCQSSPLR